MKVLLDLHPMDPDWRALQPLIEKDTALRGDITLVVTRQDVEEATCSFVVGQHTVATHPASCVGIERKRQFLHFLTANFAA